MARDTINANFMLGNFSYRWVGEMGEVVILVDGVYIHDDNNYVVNGLKP